MPGPVFDRSVLLVTRLSSAYLNAIPEPLFIALVQFVIIDPSRWYMKNPSPPFEILVQLSRVLSVLPMEKPLPTLFSQTVTSGFYTVEWNGTDERGEQMPSGIYYYSLQLPDQTETKRMVLLR